MDEAHLYDRINEAIRNQILEGKILPGERLPSISEMIERWGCSPGTIQRAYRDLAASGLVVSRPGKGTFAALGSPQPQAAPLRRAALVHRAEAVLLEGISGGHSIGEIEQAVRIALDRWRVMQPIEPVPAQDGIIRFAGSHDPGISWLAAHFPEFYEGCQINLHFLGSLGGLINLAEGSADMAGCHLWDEESDTYNIPFIRRILPGKRVALLHVAYRSLGLILPVGNPEGIHSLKELARKKIRFINRQSGSGTRVWLDAQLRLLGINPAEINGYPHEVHSHSAVAQAVAEGAADCGFGLQTSAMAYKLAFEPLTREEYHLVFPAAQLERPVVKAFIEWMGTSQVKAGISSLGGYDTSRTGLIQMID